MKDSHSVMKQRWEHARRTRTYLKLLDYLIVADPMNRDEKNAIRQRFVAKGCSPPARLSLESMQLSPTWRLTHADDNPDVLETWADECWDSVVVDAKQLNQIHTSSSHNANTVRRRSRRGYNIRSCSIYLDHKSDLVDEWQWFSDLLEACGVQFTQSELTALAIANGGLLAEGGFLTTLVQRLSDAGTMMIAVDSGSDGNCFLFFPIRNQIAIEKLLRDLWPKETQSAGGHYFGDWRLLSGGESYFHLLLPFTHDELHHAPITRHTIQYELMSGVHFDSLS